jgi:hypothetical protein
MAAALETTGERVRAWRLHRQLLEPISAVPTPEVVRRLAGVQAQVPSAAEVAVAVRQADPAPDAVAAALAEGSVVRTWAMRGTLHLLDAAAAGAHLALMAAGRSWEKASWVKAFGVTPDDMAVLTEAVAEILDDQVLTRDQLVTQLGVRLGHRDLEDELRSGWGAVLKPVAWQGALCHGPPIDGKVTFARPDRLLPTWTGLPDADEAARTVVPAYLRTYGPATIERFDAWLTRGTSRKGQLRSWFAAVADDVVTVDVEGTEAHLLADDVDDLAAVEPTDAVHLLPAFDQWVLGPGTKAAEILDPAHRAEVSRAAGWIAPVVIAGGRVVGVWDQGGGAIEVTLFDGVRPPAAALAAAVARMDGVLAAVRPG